MSSVTCGSRDFLTIEAMFWAVLRRSGRKQRPTLCFTPSSAPAPDLESALWEQRLHLLSPSWSPARRRLRKDSLGHRSSRSLSPRLAPSRKLARVNPFLRKCRETHAFAAPFAEIRIVLDGGKPLPKTLSKNAALRMATGGFAVFQPWWKTTLYPHPWIFQRNKTQHIGAK